MSMDYTRFIHDFLMQNLNSLWTISILTMLGALIIGGIAFFAYRGSQKRDASNNSLTLTPAKNSTKDIVRDGGRVAHNLPDVGALNTPDISTLESSHLKPDTVNEAPSNHRMPPPGGRFMEYLTLKGFFNVGFIAVLFLRGIQFLRKNLPPIDESGLGGSSRALYQLPWYIMIGAASSGKTYMMKGSTLKFPVGQPTFGGGEDPMLRFWFLNRGVVLDIRGNFFINSRDNRSDEKNWRNVLSLLGRYRPKRPLDGIILTLPVSEFLGENALTHDQRMDRARALAQKLHITQKNLGMSLPLYIMVTKCDLIPGFTHFCKELPEHLRQSILGWSNPYHIDRPYQKQWMDEAFFHIDTVITSLQHELFEGYVNPDNQDGIFIFPHHVQRLKEGLSDYVNSIFKESAYHEHLSLRGLYLSGAQDGVSTCPIADHTSEPTLSDAQKPMRVCFVDDVFSDKIFRETGLAQPVTQRVTRANRHLRIAEISTAALVCVGTVGVLQTYSKLKKQNQNILPILHKMNGVLGMLRHQKGDDYARSLALFDDYTSKLIAMMHTLSESDFTSIFIPPSWFSPLRDNLNQSLKVSYNHIILRTIYIDLLLKGRELLYQKLTPYDHSSRLSQVINPRDSVEIDVVYTFVDRLADLERMVNLFNRLDEDHTLASLRQLVKYTFKADLPSAFDDEFQNFYKILKDAPFPKINLNNYAKSIQNNLITLYTHFLKNVMDAQNPGSILGRIHDVIHTYEASYSGAVPNADKLREFTEDLNASVPVLMADKKPWLDDPYLDLGDEFRTMMSTIQKTPLLGGVDMVHTLALESARVFQRFKADMIRMIPSVRDAMLFYGDAGFSSLPHESTWTPSTLLVQLHKGFSMLFQQPFMQRIPYQPLTTVIPAQHIVYWDSKLIESADAMLLHFDKFRKDILPLLPPTMRDVLDRTAYDNMQANILSTIARAQNIIPIQRVDAMTHMLGYRNPLQTPPYTTNAMRYESARDEEILRSQIANFRDTAPKFLNMLRALGASGAGEAFVSLRNLLSSQAVQLLESIERVAMAQKPYSIQGNSFKWWTGEEGAILGAFYVRDETDFMGYLTLQRDRLKHWSLNYAEPLITFLTSDVMLDAPFARTLVERWRRIVDQMVKFEQRRPDTTLHTLETDLSTLNHVNLDNCIINIPLSTVRGTSGDFFQDVDTLVRRELRARCEVLLRQRSIQHYQELASFFNENLKDKFPFVGDIALNNKGEAEPEDIKTFFTLYKKFGDSPEAILNQIADINDNNKDAYEFLQGMERVKAFFKPYLESDTYEALPELDISVDFRVNRKAEQNANYIVDWAFENGDTATLNNHMKDRLTRWTFGDACEFSLRWPDNAGVEPTLDEGQKYMTVEEKTAYFSITSRWSVLWMIRVFGQDRPSQTEPSPYMLKFSVPLSPTRRAVVYNRISLREPASSKKPGKLIDLPTFPVMAPALSQTVLDAADRPVLTKSKDVVTAQLIPGQSSRSPLQPTQKDTPVGITERTDNTTAPSPVNEAKSSNPPVNTAATNTQPQQNNTDAPPTNRDVNSILDDLGARN